jgi:hypothetical protein
MPKLPDWANWFIIRRTASPSRPWTSASSRSKLEDTWMSMDGEIVGVTPRFS